MRRIEESMCVTTFCTYCNQQHLEERDKEHTNMDHADFDGLEKPRLIIAILDTYHPTNKSSLARTVYRYIYCP